MQEHDSTQSVPWTFGTSSTGSPAPAGTIACGRRGLPRRPCFTGLCHGGNTCFPRVEGRGVEGGWFPHCFPEPPCVILWPRVTVHEHTTSRVSTGWGVGGRGGGKRHEGLGFWDTNPRRNSLRGPTCVQGGKKNLTLHMGKHPLCEKAHLHVGNLPTLPHTEGWCPDGGDKAPLRVFKGLGPEKRGLCAWERRILVRRPMSA